MGTLPKSREETYCKIQQNDIVCFKQIVKGQVNTMSLLQYEYFIATYENRGYRKAAQELFLTDGAISGQVKKLENRLGVKLFETKGRRLIPTPVANELYEQCKIVIREDKKVLQIAQKQKFKAPKSVSIAIPYQPTRGAILPAKVEKLLAECFPDTRIETENYPNGECANAVRSGLTHGAFTLTRDFDDLKTVEEFLSFRPMLMVKSDDPLAEFDSVSKENLKGRTFGLPVDVGVFFEKFKNYTDSVDGSKTEAPGFTLENHRDFLEKGGCVFVTPDKRLKRIYPGAVMLPIDDFNSELSISLITRNEETPETMLLGQFASELKKALLKTRN